MDLVNRVKMVFLPELPILTMDLDLEQIAAKELSVNSLNKIQEAFLSRIINLKHHKIKDSEAHLTKTQVALVPTSNQESLVPSNRATALVASLDSNLHRINNRMRIVKNPRKCTRLALIILSKTSMFPTRQLINNKPIKLPNRKLLTVLFR